MVRYIAFRKFCVFIILMLTVTAAAGNNPAAAEDIIFESSSVNIIISESEKSVTVNDGMKLDEFIGGIYTNAEIIVYDDETLQYSVLAPYGLKNNMVVCVSRGNNVKYYTVYTKELNYSDDILLYEDFETLAEGAYSSANGISSITKDSTGGRQKIVSENGNNMLNIGVDYISSAAAHDSYIESSRLNFNGIFYISAKLKSEDSSKGEISVSLRDNSLDSSRGSLIFAAIKDGAVSFLNNTNIQINYVNGTEHTIGVLINSVLNSVIIYCDGKAVSQIDNFRTIKNNYYKNFNLSAAALRIRSAVKNGTINTYIDDISVLPCSMLEHGIYTTPVLYYKENFGEYYRVSDLQAGSYKCAVIALNTQNSTLDTNFICSVFNGRKLENVNVKKCSFSGASLMKTEVLCKINNVSAETELKTFLWKDKIMDIKTLTNNTIIYPSSQEILDTLNSRNGGVHPRLLINSSKVNSMRFLCKNDTVIKGWYGKIKASADSYLKYGLPVYEDSDPIRLQAAHNLSGQLPVLAFVYLIENDAVYADKAYEMMEAAAAFDDWGPGHFLDVSAMLLGFGIAYDWCYNYYKQTPEKLAVIENAIAEKGLTMARDAYLKTLYTKNYWWVDGQTNWNIVCNGGIAIGALAVADVDKYGELAGFTLEQGLKSLNNVLWRFAPDGAWFEGPGYWQYTVSFLAMYVSSLQSALGSDYGIISSEGMAHTAYYPIQSTGASVTFNLNDAAESAVNSPEYFFLAKQYGDSNLGGYRYYQLTAKNISPSYKDIIWYDADLINISFNDTIEKDGYYRDSEVATFRNSYKGNNINFAGIHGGKNKIEHGQLDVGTFVYESNGVRWAVDLGGDQYNLAQYWNMNNVARSRWGYYRHRAEGHNTIVINPGALADQDLDSNAEIIYFNSDDMHGTAVVDMLTAFKDYATSAKRGIKLDKLSGALIVQDEILMKSPQNLYWFMHTKADITLSEDKKTALLHQNGKYVKVICAEGGTFEIMSASPLSSSPNPDEWPENMAHTGTSGSPTHQNTNTGISKLAVHMPEAQGNVLINIYISPVLSAAETVDIPEIIELNSWR